MTGAALSRAVEFVKVAEDEEWNDRIDFGNLASFFVPSGPAQGAVPFLLSIEILAPSGRTAGLIAERLRDESSGLPARRAERNQLNTQAIAKRTRINDMTTINPA